MNRSHWRSVGLLFALGSLASAHLLAETETYTYDDLGRLVVVEHGDNKASTYSLDPAGNRKNVQTSDGTPPTVPTNLAATAASATQINVSWTASTDNVGVTDYWLERCQGAGCSTYSQIAKPTGVSYSDTPVSDVTTFTYRVRARDASGNLSGNSATASATTPDGTAPSVPTNVVAIAVSSTQINLTWTASTDNVAVTGYRVERCTGVSCSNFVQVGTPAGPSFNNSSLADVTTYRYRVRARDAIPNLSGYSSIVTATTWDGTAPSTPTGFTATAVAYNQVNLAWTASTDNVAVTGYEVERCAGSGCSNYTKIAAPTSNSYTNTPVSGSSTYRYRVRASDAFPNFSGYSAVKTVTTPAGVPVAPVITPSTLLKKSVGESYTISWNAVTGATSYELFDSGSSVWTGTATSRNFPSAVQGEHLYTVKACNASGCSTGSNGRLVLVCLSVCE
jgi:YD repeat-containing protein